MKYLAFTLSLLASASLQAQPALHISTSDIRPESTYQLVFDRAVVPENTVNTTTANSILEIKPSLNGELRWSSQNIAHFIPSEAPKMSTKYTFSISPKLQHLDKSPIPAGKIKTTSSEDFRATYHRKSSVNNRMPISYVRFNDDVAPKNIGKYFYYVDKEGHKQDAVVRQATWSDLESTYYIRPSWQQRFLDFKAKQTESPQREKTETKWEKNSPIPNGVIVTPEKPLPIGEKWNLVIKEGLTNNTKSYQTSKPVSHYIWSIKPFEVKDISPVVRADHPREVMIHFNSSLPHKLKEEELANLITITPQPADLKITQYSSTSIIAKGDFNKTSNFKVTVSEDLTALNGLTLEKSTVKDITFNSVTSGIGLPTFNTAQLSKGNRTYTVDTVNMKEIRVRVKALDPKQLIRTEQGYRHYTGDGHNYDEISPVKPLPFELISGETIFDKIIPLDNKVDTSKRITLNWDEILPAKQKSASLFVSVVGVPKDQLTSKESLKREAQAIVQLTDIGLAWKLAEDYIWVYTYSLETGQPVPSANVSIYGEDAKLLQSAKSDKQGLAKLPRSEADRHLIANLADDRFAVTFDNSLSTVQMWRFPVSFGWSEKTHWERDMMSFTDRNLYRPGDKVRYKAILREYMDNQIRLTKDNKVKVQLRDPNNKVLFEREISLTSNGTLDTEFDLPAEKVGNFSIHCQLLNKEASEESSEDEEEQSRTAFHHYFSVQEFRRNAFEISANLPEPNPGDTNIQLDVEAKYYQGTPVAEGELQWYFTSTPTGFYPKNFRDFKFGDHREYDSYYWSYYFGYNDDTSNYRDTEHKNGKLSLTSDGTASVSMDIPQQEFPSPQRLSFTSSIRDSRDQTLSNTQQVTHHPTAIYYGISRRDQLTRINDTFDLNIISVGTDGEYAKTNSKVSVNIQREYNVSNKVKADDGTVRVQNETKTEDLSTQDFEVIAGKANPLSITAEKPGRYIITVTGADAEGRKSISASSVYIYGSDVYPWATEDGMRIKLVSEKKNYMPGDTARILVMTPIEGTALVSVERKGVIKTFRRTLSVDKPVIEFPIDDDMAPNAYVSVLVIRGAADSPHKYKQPALKLGFCEIKVTDPSKKLDIALNIPGTYHRPGEEVTVTGKVTDHRGRAVTNSEVVLFAEDEGTLAVMGYSTPSPLAHFHRDRPLTLLTGVSLSSIVSENPRDNYFGNKGFTIGGGDAFGVGFGEEKKEFKPRNNFDPCAAWFPTIMTDSQGTFKVSFQTPDTLTRYRVMATALAGADRFGSTSTDLVVSKNIMLEPKPPRFAYEGDIMSQRVLVQNASSLAGTWDISLTTDSLTRVVGSTENTLAKSITLNAGEQATVSFDVAFINTGETTWTWKAEPRELDGTELTPATRSEYSDAMTNKFEVTYPRPLLRHANFIRFEDASDERINLVAGVNPILMNGRGHADLELSNSLLLEAGGAVDYLLKYPYGCVEQTSSSLMPWFAVRDLKSVVPGFSDTSEKKVSTAIQKGADRLLSMQTSSGGLAYWPGDNEPTDWATAYGGMALLLAKQHGANVPDAAIDGVTKYLAEFLRNPQKEKYNQWHADTECRALYVLALAGKPQHAFQNKFYDMKDKLGESSRAFLALAIHHSGGSKEQAISLLTDPTKDDPNSYWMRYRANIPSQLLAWSTIDPKGEQADKKLQELLQQRNRQGHWHTTWVNGWALHSMAAYARYVEADRLDATITLHLDSGTKTIKLSKEKPIQSIRLSLEDAKNLHASSDHKAFAHVLVSSKPEVAPTGPIGNNGLAIKRRYEFVTSDGKTSPLLYPKVGDLVLVTLDITFSNELPYVSIDDPLPSTFEIVNDDFASQAAFISSKKNWSVSRTELRDDRALFFLNRSWRGRTDSVSYLARITAEGEVHAPPAKVEAMYDPSKYALSGAQTITTTR